jgi:MSHA type pilus biogenesis protein MshL
MKNNCFTIFKIVCLKVFHVPMKFILCFLLSLCACQDMVDRKPIMKEATKADMKTLTTQAEIHPKTVVESKKIKPPLPKEMLQPVSVNISETLSLKPVLIELARQAGVDLQLDPKIDAKVVFSAKNRPFIEVIEHVCSLGNLRYRLLNNVSLRIEPDTPYTENYQVQFLNFSRNSQNRISIATDVFSSVSTQKVQNDNGSNSSVTVSTNTDFWAELEANLKMILSQTAPLADGATPPSYSLHKQAGMVSILGTSRHHALVADYLGKLRKAASSQVLIEAKIVEVLLKDEYRSGINWQKVGTRGDWQFTGKFGDMSTSSRLLDPVTAQSDMVAMGASGQTFSGILKAIQDFGASRTLSSPRLTVMNNQTAILKVAENQVYFRLNYDKQFSTAVQRESVNVSSDIQTVPIGLVMSVQPSIDPETQEIILFLRPTISRLSQSVRDPAVDIAYNSNINANTNTSALAKESPSLIPVVEVREIDSVLRLKSEEIAILGGLMEVRSIQDKSKLPILGDTPLVKDLFSSTTEGEQVVELVILLKASILESATPHGADERLVKYIPDPRPLS